MARRRAWSAAPSATRCSACRRATRISRPRRARGGGAARESGRHQERADRHRPRHRHAGHRQRALRSHDAARGHRNLRPQGQGRVRPRLGEGRRAARFHDERPVGRRGGRRVRLCRRHRGCQSAARALHRRARPAHRRGLFAHPALLPHPCRLRRRRARSRRLPRLHPRPRRPCDAVGRTRAHGDAEIAGGGRRVRSRACDGRCRLAAGADRRRRLYRAADGDDRDRARAAACRQAQRGASPR